MFRHKQNNKFGFSMVEIILALGISGIAILSIGSIFNIVGKINNMTANIHEYAGSSLVVNRILNRHIYAISAARFDPTKSYLTGNEEYPIKVGPLWSFETDDDAIPATFNFEGRSFIQNSSTIEVYEMKIIRGVAEKITKGLMLSRCVDGPEFDEFPTELNDIYDLPFPVLSKSGFRCCTHSSQCSNENQTNMWPTVFVYFGENNIVQYPIANEREILTGVGFFIEFDGDPPRSYIMKTVLLKNDCVISSRRRSGGRECEKPKEGVDVKPYFSEDVYVEVKQVRRDLITNATDSSFISIGDKMYE